MESIKGHPEHVETVFGEAIVARDEALLVLSGACGLGPPDLCWLQKAPKSALTGSSGEARGYYHYCLGVDASSSASVAAYFATMTSMVESHSFLQGLFSTTEYRIERGFYCVYDPFSRLDVRCELCVPGGVVCGALDCEGNVHDVTPDLWRNCVVATFLRSELYDPEMVTYSTAPVVRHPSLTPGPLMPPRRTSGDAGSPGGGGGATAGLTAAESRLLEAVWGLYEDGVLPEALEGLTVDQSGGVSAEHGDVVLHVLLHYFSRRQRWGTALDFFARLSSVYPTAALYVAAVQRECGLYEEALGTLQQAAEAYPDDPLLLTGLATEALYAEQLDASLQAATRACRVRPGLRPAWLALARAFVRLGAGGAAMVVLNLVPPPPAPGTNESMLHVTPAPEPKAVTRPAVPPYDLDLAAARHILQEEAVLHPVVPGSAAASLPAPGSRPAALSCLPGAPLVHREPADAALAPDTSPDRITKAVFAAVYTVLQELVAVSGWDGFLALRSAVFVMHADSEVLRQQQQEAEEREVQLRLLHRQLSATLPHSPQRLAAAAAAAVAPGGPLPMDRRPPPEGTDFEYALDEAVAMGLSDYPEHLEEGYDPAQVAAAREAHRRHLREIAERQAALEAADGGCADDEWDESGSGEGEGDRGEAGGRGTPGRRGRRAAAGRGRRGRKSSVLGLPGAEEDEAAGARSPPEEQGEGQVERQVELQAQEEALPAAGSLQQAPSAASVPASSGWWGMLFGGGGDASGGQQVRAREAGPLGEGCEGACLALQRACEAAAESQAQEAHQHGPPWHGAAGALGAPAACMGSRGVGRGECGLAVRCPGALSTEGEEQQLQIQGRQVCGAPAYAVVPRGKEQQHRDPHEVLVEVLMQRAGRGRGGGHQRRWESGMSLGALCCALLEARRRQGQGQQQQGVEEGCGSPCGPQAEEQGAAGAPGLLVLLPALPPAVVTGPGVDGCRGAAQQKGRAQEVRVGCTGETAVQRGWQVCREGAEDGSTEIVWWVPAGEGGMGLHLSTWAGGRDSGRRGDIRGKGGMPGRAGRGARLLLRLRTALQGGRRRGAAARRLRAGSYAAAGALLQGCSLRRQGSGRAATAVAEAADGTRPTPDAAAAAEVPRLSASGAADRTGDAVVAAAGSAANAAAAGSAGEGGSPGRPSTSGAAGGGLPLLLQDPEADRQLLLQGMDVGELGAKRLCVRWLDELIVALWHDLQSFLDWKALDTELADAGFGTHAEIVAGLAPSPTAVDYTRPKAPAPGPDAAPTPADGAPLPRPPILPSVPALDWLRRALLAERLHHEPDALAAYQAAIMTPPPPPAPAAPAVLPAGAGGASPAAAAAAAGNVFAAVNGAGPGAFSLIGWHAVMRLAPAGEPRETGWALKAVQAVMTWHEKHVPQGAMAFTSGYVASGGEAAAGAGGGGAAGAGGGLRAVPLAAVYCLHLVAAVLGEEGVEAAIAPVAAEDGEGKGAEVGSAGAGAARKQVGRPKVHPAAAAVLRKAAQMSAAARAAAAAAGAAAAGGASLDASPGASGGGGGEQEPADGQEAAAAAVEQQTGFGAAEVGSIRVV